jgi:hypothetical protein
MPIQYSLIFISGLLKKKAHSLSFLVGGFRVSRFAEAYLGDVEGCARTPCMGLGREKRGEEKNNQCHKTYTFYCRVIDLFSCVQ